MSARLALVPPAPDLPEAPPEKSPWFDFDSRGCPLCGKSLIFDPYERPRGPFAHMTCGGFDRHRWLVYRRGPRIGFVWTRMRLLGPRTYSLW